MCSASYKTQERNTFSEHFYGMLDLEIFKIAEWPSTSLKVIGNGAIR